MEAAEQVRKFEEFFDINYKTELSENIRKGEVIEIIDNTSEHMGGSGLPPELMKKHQADVLLCGDIGPRAISLCTELGIEVYICRVSTVKEAFDLWQKNQLKKADTGDACEQHQR